MKKILILLTLKLFITSCATPTVVNVIQPKDNELNCKELNLEIAKANQYARSLLWGPDAGAKPLGIFWIGVEQLNFKVGFRLRE